MLLISILLTGRLKSEVLGGLPFINTRRVFQTQLDAFGARDASDTSRVTLSELGPVSRNEVRNWFSTRTDLRNEADRLRLADLVFDTAQPRVRDLRRYLSLQGALRILKQAPSDHSPRS